MEMVAFFMMSVALFMMGSADASSKLKKPVDINTLSKSDIKKGIVVEGAVQANLGTYEITRHTRRGVEIGEPDYSYVILLSDGTLMGVENGLDSMNSIFEQQERETLSYMLGERKETPTPVDVHGVVQEMTSYKKNLFIAQLKELGLEDEDITLNSAFYYIENKYNGYWWCELIGAVACFAMGIFYVYKLYLAKKPEDIMSAHDDWEEYSQSYGRVAANDNQWEDFEEVSAPTPPPVSPSITPKESTPEPKKSSTGLSLKNYDD